MTEDEQGRKHTKLRWLWLSLAALLAILAVLIVPPLLSVSRYKSQITSLVASSLGRPVRLSSVRVRLLPRPGFVLYDLVVDDNPAFGAEPVIHANAVTAPVRIWSLWRGKLEISEISVDEASLNLVRTPDGLWNLDSLLETTASNAGKLSGDGKRVAPFPRLVATNSRINFKRGVEKLPFSLVDTDLSFWQSNPGEWRLRLRGQPARTDVSLNSADTGIVEIEATARQTPDLRKMPIHLDLDWRDAQLGQLTRLMTGSDAGWRGDLRGELHVDGTAENAQIKTRLRATGVHRAEFAPPAPMDFDANCGLVYHYTQRTLENLVCDSPLGDGRIRITGEVPGNGRMSHYSLEMDKVPAGAGLEALRTVRSGVDPSLNAAGTISGKVTYDEVPVSTSALKKPSSVATPVKPHAAKAGTAPAASLSGSFTVEGFQLSGGGLSKPLQAPKIVLAPAPVAQGHAQVLAGTVAVLAGAPVPLTVDLRFALKSYQVEARGQVSIQRARELAHAAGLVQASALDSMAGDPLSVDLSAQGPWLPVEDTLTGDNQPTIAATGAVSGLASKAGVAVAIDPKADSLSGTVTVRNANWKADYLASHVEIADATLRIYNGGVRWDPIDFSYGPLKGIASLTLPRSCDPAGPCPVPPLPIVTVQFNNLDAATVQTAILGAHEKGTLLFDLLNRLHPSSPPVWPLLEGTVTADSLILGPVTLQGPKAQLRIGPTGIDITALDGKLLGGMVHATGTLITGDKPAYTLSADFQKLNPVAVGQLLSQNWRGGAFDANGKIELSGYTGSDLATSAKGTLHFEWSHGSAAVPGGASPAAIGRFDRWRADAEIANGKVTLGQNELTQGGGKHAVAASVTLTEPLKVSFAGSKPAQTPKH